MFLQGVFGNANKNKVKSWCKKDLEKLFSVGQTPICGSLKSLHIAMDTVSRLQIL